MIYVRGSPLTCGEGRIEPSPFQFSLLCFVCWGAIRIWRDSLCDNALRSIDFVVGFFMYLLLRFLYWVVSFAGLLRGWP